MKQNISPIHTWKSVFIFGFFLLILAVSGYKKNVSPEADPYFITKNEIISCPPAINQMPTDLEEITINDNQKPAGE